MKLIKLADSNICTGCGACAAQCPRSCISMIEGDDGILLPQIDVKTCIECHSCENVCPVIHSPERYEPQQAYAAWSNDVEERRTSASGGVALEIYKYAISKGWKVVGASQNEDFSVTHKLVSTIEELPPLKNSKYVFSDAYDAFKQIKILLKDNIHIVFIGLPCQVAALRKLFRNSENLLLIEVVCHGATPLKYLVQHIHYLESCEGHVAKQLFFRDPDSGTYTYTFALYDETGKRFYAKRTRDGDTYLYGYHLSISYRENCFHCQFAKRQRVADITLGDYHGLGTIAPCGYLSKKVSCVLCNSSKGKAFLDEFIKSNRIYADCRPIEEPIAGDARLRESNKKTKARCDFEKISLRNGYDFEMVMKEVIKRNKKRMIIHDIIHDIHKISRRVFRKIKKIVKQFRKT